MVNNGNMYVTSGKKRPIVNTATGAKMVIYERELKLYGQTGAIQKVLAVMPESKSDKASWELHFVIKGISKEEDNVLVTSLGKPRQFKNLNHMVELLKEWCPNVSSIDLNIQTHKTK